MPVSGNDLANYFLTGDLSGSIPDVTVVGIGNINSGTLSVPYGGTGLSSVTAKSLVYGNDAGPFGYTDIPITSGSIAMFDGTTWQIVPTLKKYVSLVGDGSNIQFTLTHNLNSEDVIVSIREVSTDEAVITNYKPSGANDLVVYFGSPPSVDEYKVTIIG